MTHLLDTDHVTFLTRRAGTARAALVANIHAHGEDQVAVSVVTVQEQVLGAHGRINRARRAADLVPGYRLLFEMMDTFRVMNVLAFDDPAAAELDRLRGMALRVKDMDLRIAAVALANHLTLVTRNVSDFGRVPNLRTEDWTR